MKLLIALALFFLPFGVYADGCCPGLDLEIKGAAFFSANHKFRKIYDNGPMVQIEASYALNCNIKPFVNIAYFSKTGHSTPLKDETHVKLTPLTFGLKYEVQLPCNFFAYVGGGGSYTWIHIHNHSHFVKSRVNADRFGGVAKVGLGYQYQCYYLTVFADYLFQKAKIHPHKEHLTDIGGAIVGGSFGIQF